MMYECAHAYTSAVPWEARRQRPREVNSGPLEPPSHLSSPRFGSLEMCYKDQACLKLASALVALSSGVVSGGSRREGRFLCRAFLGIVPVEWTVEARKKWWQ